MAEKLAVPPLRSGGIMLGYGCNQSCRHCLYRCGPDAGGEWMDSGTLETVMETLACEKRLVDIHFGGGELTLKPGPLRDAIALAKEKGLRISYLETNGFFADTVEKAVGVLRPLKEAGLPAILLSISPYHNEFVPLRKTVNCLRAGQEVFGDDGVFPWQAHFLAMLAKMDPDAPHPLEEFLAANDMRPSDKQLLRLFPVTPGGSVPERLREFFAPHPAEAFAGGNCLDMLQETSHFHIDPQGRLFTGVCPGLAAGTVPDLHDAKTYDNAPIFATLAMGGPHALMRMAEDACGFVPDPDGYVSPCDLCFQVRQALFRHDAEAWPELGPTLFYRERR